MFINNAYLESQTGFGLQAEDCGHKKTGTQINVSPFFLRVT